MRLSVIPPFIAAAALAVAASAAPPAPVGPPPGPVGTPPSAVSVPSGVGAPPALAPTATGSNVTARVSSAGQLFVGMDLNGANGAFLGEVADLIRGAGDQVTAVVILTPDGIRHVLPLSRVSIQSSVLVTPLSEDQVQTFPEP